MKSNRFDQIGLDRLVRLALLEKVSSLVLSGNKLNEIKAILRTDLKEAFRSERTDVRGSIDKTITILTKVWLTVPKELESFRIEGLELLKLLSSRDCMPVHWGMITAVYPFWSSVATQLGRLLKLQGAATAANIQRRLSEQYGDRETVSRRARYVLRSYVDWGVIQETAKKGIYKANTPLIIRDHRLVAWLVEASLYARSTDSASLRVLLESPSLFPFDIRPVNATNLQTVSSKLEVVHQGLSEDLVILQKA